MIYCHACGTNLKWPWDQNAPTEKAKCQVCKKETICFDSEPKKPAAAKAPPMKAPDQVKAPDQAKEQKPEAQKPTKQKYQRYQ